MRKLSREYGWSGLGVYLMLSALDFPFCYLLVRTLGTDRIGEWVFFLDGMQCLVSGNVMVVVVEIYGSMKVGMNLRYVSLSLSEGLGRHILLG